jgi:hypothetical protein
VLERSRDALVVRWAVGATPETIAVTTAPLRDAVRTLRQPDRALIAVTEEAGAKRLSAIGVRVGRWQRAGVLLGALALLLLFAALLSTGRVRQLALGQDGRYSGSKFQTVVWFGALIVSYLATVALRGWAGGAQFAGGVSVPERLLILSGLSALSFVGAKAITQGKVDRAETLAREQPGLSGAIARKTPAPRPSFPGDLVTDDHGRSDFGSFQMIVVTLIAVAIYLVRVFACLGQVALDCATRLPEVDTALLGALAIGQGAYLAKKAASRLGEG